MSFERFRVLVEHYALKSQFSGCCQSYFAAEPCFVLAGLACCMEGSVAGIPRTAQLPDSNRKETCIKEGNLASKGSYVSVFWFSTKYLFQATHTQSAINQACKLGVPGQVVKNL